MVPAIDPDDFLKSAKPRRTITAKKFENYQATNIVEKQVRNNTRCFDIPTSKTQQYSNSFFVSTVINWNHLEDTIVRETSVEICSHETSVNQRRLHPVVLKPELIATT